MKNLIFNMVFITHMLCYVFLFTAWIFPETALINLLLVVPLTILLYLGPNCPLTSLENFIQGRKDGLGVYTSYENFLSKFEHTFANPFNHQGLLLISMIMSVYSLYFRGLINVRIS